MGWIRRRIAVGRALLVASVVFVTSIAAGSCGGGGASGGGAYDASRPADATAIEGSDRDRGTESGDGEGEADGGEASPDDAGQDGPDVDARASTPQVDYGGAAFLDAPFPDERLRKADGTIDLSGFPDGDAGVALVVQLKTMLSGATGFGRTTGAFFALDGPIDPASLPDLATSLTANATVFLMDVDSTSTEKGTRFPVSVSFEVDGGPFAAPNLLSVLPLQGRPLRPTRLYAAVLTTGVTTTARVPLGVAPATAQIVAGSQPPSLGTAAFAAHQQAVTALVAAGIDPARIAATAVFRTGDPVDGLARARQQVESSPLPAPDGPFAAKEVFNDYCVFQTTIGLPVFQGGTPPYATPAAGGDWRYDTSGLLVSQGPATSNLWVTIPRRAMPASGFPLTVFVRTDGGGDRPLVDRGAQAFVDGGLVAPPGSGPAMDLARAGFAGVSVDGPLGGLRNAATWNESYALVNVQNPAALRDNIRQSALELMLFSKVLPSLRFDASSCAGFSTPSADGFAFFDTSTLTLMSHSLGTTMASLAVALEPSYRAFVASGAGASWIETFLYEQKPTPWRPVVELLLQYGASGRQLTEHDIALSLLQWALEPADPQVYAEQVVTSPVDGGAARHVLVLEGLLDTYEPPPVANPLTLSLGLDLGGNELDTSYPAYTPLSSLLTFSGGSALSLPVSGNRSGGTTTALITQNPQDAIEDGNETVFQTDPPKRQYRCFLQSFADSGVPRVPDGTGDAGSCN